jgi:polysaccharide chain length determinant protein (PEP-CTERM system associated)
MAALFLLASCIGVVVALRLPTMYSTQATLLVEAAQIDDVESVRVDANEQLDVIQQRLLTRANLIRVARDNTVFPNQNLMDPDDIVSQMRQRTRIRRSSGRNSATVMTISFDGPRPEQVAAVVNQYVNVVLEINSDFRVGQAEGALEFFEQEVERLSDDLDLQSAKIVAFKSKNADALPENLDYRLSRQSLLQERLSRSERDLEAATLQRTNLMRIYEVTGSVVPANVPRTPEEQRLQDLENQLRTALTIYSETNPRVVLLRNQIKVLEGQVQQATALLNGSEDSSLPAEQATALDISLAELDSRIENLVREIAEATEELETLQDSIARTPTNRISLEAMERDLANIQVLYSSAVTRLSQARMGERIELSAKGERITVLEPASVPTSPSGPNRTAIAGMGVGVGAGLAAGLFALLELLNQAIRRPADIVRALDITPLATVPRFETVADRRWRRTVQLGLLAVVIVAVPSLLWAIDTFYMPLDELFQKVIERF